MANKRTKKQIISRMNKIGYTTRLCNGTCSTAGRDAGDIDIENRTIPFVIISAQNAGERYDWWKDEVYIEELDIAGADFGNLRTFFTDHYKSVHSAIGRVENTRVEDDTIKSEVVFGTDADADKIFQKYVDGILTDVSIGYIVNDVVITEKKDEPTHVLVTDYEIVELSGVWRGFDSGAGRSKPTDPKPKKRKKSKKSKKKSNTNIDMLRKKLNLKEKKC